MKKSILIWLCLFIAPIIAKAQEINWRNLEASNKHLLSLQIGMDYGTVYGFSYGYQLPFNHPIIIGTGLSTPLGANFMDDYKVNLNVQTEVWHNNGFSIAVKPGGSMRRYHAAVAHLYNIGLEFNTTIGYYKPTWGVAMEAGYDWSRATYIEHNTLKDYYPDIQDGWYGSTGGNFKFGIKGNYWMKSIGIALKVGKVYGQDFENNPTVPYYTELSVVKKF